MRTLTSSQALLFGLVLSALLFLALFPFFPRQLNISEGDVAARDIISPVSKTFESDVLTQQARDDAARAVPDVLIYNPDMRAQQVAKLEAATSSITTVRDDATLEEAAKRARLLAVPDLSGLSRSSIDTVLALTPERWQEIQNEGEVRLGDVLGRSIAPDGVGGEQDRLPQEVSPGLSADETQLVGDLVRPLIVATLVINEEATANAREAAQQNVQPVQQSVAENQTIVLHGSRIDATTAEILGEVGLLSPRVRWNHLLAVLGIAPLAAIVLALYLWNFPVRGISGERNLGLLALMIALPIFAAKLYFSLVLPDDSQRFLAYFLPLAAAPMLIATLLETRLAVVVAFVQATLMAFAVVSLPDLSLVGTIEPLDATRVFFVYGLGAVVGVFAVRRAERANQYLMAGLLISLATLALLFTTWLLEAERDPIEAAWITAASATGGLSSGLLTAGGFAFVGAVLGVTTRVQLMELAQLNAPLLRKLQDEAPGTFHHSIIVGNLAERAADLVGADALLVRVGCYYHDIGKVLQPGFYIENQLGGSNPHDDLDPHSSARIIAEHVRGGVDLAKQNGLPPAVQAFIPEHHGTRLIPYFYRIASQQDPNVDESGFRYPGPRPQTRETAIVMLADSTEAMVRASADRSTERIDQMVDEVLAERLAEGELEECDLTFRDLRTIAQSFKQTLRGVYHPRIAYPEPSEGERQALIGRFRPGRRSPANGSPADGPARPTRPGRRSL